MAMAAACSSSRSSTVTIYGPREVKDDFPGFDLHDYYRVAAKIDKMCRKSKLKAEYLGSGFCCCLGLLDPATNIIINGSIFNSAASCSVQAQEQEQREGTGKRSLDGLIAFLACLFPFLPDAEALSYLEIVDVDPMAAAALILAKRGVKSDYCAFRNAATMEMALRCAAVAAKHPDPSLLVKGWKTVSHNLTELNRRLSCHRRPDTGAAANFVHRVLGTAAFHHHVEVREAWRLANVRLGHCSFRSGTELPSVRAVMKRMLLARIHGFYLKALSRLPKDELTNKYHRALLMGGYCYGPLNPDANIIANTVWYEQTFPPSVELESAVAMISTPLLSRIVARSLYGLITFLCARYPLLTTDHAMQRLLVADVNLQLADPNLFDDMRRSSDQKLDWSDCPQIGSGKDDNIKFQERAVRKAVVSVQEAYAAAATAAFHPSPAAQKEFLGSPESVKILDSASSVLHLDGDDRRLSKRGIDFLGMHLLSPPCSVGMSHLEQEPEPAEECRACARDRGRFCTLHDEFKRMVLSALEKFNRDNKTQYILHVICGVNEQVSGPVLCSIEDRNLRSYSASFPCKYLHFHFNFLATCLDEEPHDQPTNLYFAHQPTKLFFAECTGDGDDWCAPVDCSPDAGQARCFYCEKQGSKIIHPAWPGFHGSDFEDAFFGSLSDLYRNDSLIGTGYSLDRVCGLEEDVIYEKNCEHQVRYDGDAVDGLEKLNISLIDFEAAYGLKRINFFD